MTATLRLRCRDAWSSSRSTAAPVRVFEGSTILDACQELGIDTPVALLRRDAAARERVPGLRRRARGRARARSRVLAEGRAGDGGEDGFGARAAQPAPGARVPRLLRRPLGDAALPPATSSATRRDPTATGRRRRRTRSATASEPGHHVEPDGQTAATVHAPVKVDNELYVRDYSKCILCYKCVDACGEQYQNTFAIAVAGRGFDARISTEYVVELPESACVYCGNCIAVCPTGALKFKSEHDMRQAGHLGRASADGDRDDLPLLRRRLQPHAPRPGRRDRQGHLARRPRHHARQSLHQGPLRVPARPGPETTSTLPSFHEPRRAPVDPRNVRGARPSPSSRTAPCARAATGS